MEYDEILLNNWKIVENHDCKINIINYEILKIYEKTENRK